MIHLNLKTIGAPVRGKTGIIVLVLAVAFLWFEVRPSILTMFFSRRGIHGAMLEYEHDMKRASGYKIGNYFPDDYEGYFKECLRGYGIEK